MALWQKCDPDGAHAWNTAPQNATILKLPRSFDSSISYFSAKILGKITDVDPKFRDPKGQGSSYQESKIYQDSIKELSCPSSELLKNAIWLIPANGRKLTGSKILAAYLRVRSQKIEQAAASTQQRVATQQAELQATRRRAQVAATTAQRLQHQRAITQQSLHTIAGELDQMRRQAAQGAPVSNDALAALEQDVSTLTIDLNQMNDDWADAQQEADFAEEAYSFQQELFAGTGTPEKLLEPDAPLIEDVLPLDTSIIDPLAEELPSAEQIAAMDEEAAGKTSSFLDQYKWHLAIGGAVIAVGALFYFTRIKPAQTAAPTSLAQNYYGFDEYDEYYF